MLADDAKAHPWVVVSSVRPRMQTPERHAAYQARYVAYRSLGRTIPRQLPGRPVSRYVTFSSLLGSHPPSSGCPLLGTDSTRSKVRGGRPRQLCFEQDAGVEHGPRSCARPREGSVATLLSSMRRSTNLLRTVSNSHGGPSERARRRGSTRNETAAEDQAKAPKRTTSPGGVMGARVEEYFE